MRILVTGGCGFVGTNFIRFLLAPGGPANSEVQRVVNLDALTYAAHRGDLKEAHDDRRYRFVLANVRDPRALERVLRAEAIDTVVHLAAESNVDRSIDGPPFSVVDTNVKGTAVLLDECCAYWGRRKEADRRFCRFLHVSTDEVYGSLGPDALPSNEATRYAPNNPYAASKAAGDHFVRAFHQTYHIPTLTVHASNNYGPYQLPEKLIPLTIMNALEGRPLPIYGDGLNIRDWLYVEDHCEALWKILRQGTPGQTYDVGGRNQCSNVAVVDQICSLLDTLAPRPDGRSYGLLKKFVPDRPGHDRRYEVDCSKAQRELGWTPRETLATGLEKTVRWYIQHKDWCVQAADRRYQRQRLVQPTQNQAPRPAEQT